MPSRPAASPSASSSSRLTSTCDPTSPTGRPRLAVDTSLGRGARALARQAARDALDERENTVPRTPISSSVSPEPKKRQRRRPSLKNQKKVQDGSSRSAIVVHGPPPAPFSNKLRPRAAPVAGPSPPPTAHDEHSLTRRRVGDKRYGEEAWPGYAAAAAEDEGFVSDDPQQRKTRSHGFLDKVYDMLADDSLQELVCWTSAGDGFIVPDVERFSRLVLPRYFTSPVYASFLRQLYSYDFSRRQIQLDDERSKVLSHHVHGPTWFRRDERRPREVKRRQSVPRSHLRLLQGDPDGTSIVASAASSSCATFGQLDRTGLSADSTAPASPSSPSGEPPTSFSAAQAHRAHKRSAAEASFDQVERDGRGAGERSQRPSRVEQLETDCHRLSTQLGEAQQRLESTTSLCKLLEKRVQDLGGSCDAHSLGVDDRHYRANLPRHLTSSTYDLPLSSSLVFGRPAEEPHHQRAPRARSTRTYEERCEWRVIAGPSYVGPSPAFEADRLLLPTFSLAMTPAPSSSHLGLALPVSTSPVSHASMPLSYGMSVDAPAHLNEQLLPEQLPLDSPSPSSFLGGQPFLIDDHYDDGYADASTHSLREPLNAASAFPPAPAHGPLDLGGAMAHDEHGGYEPAAHVDVDVEASAWAAAYAERFGGEWYADVHEPCEGSAPRVVGPHSSAGEAHLEYSSLARACGGGRGGGGAAWSSR
ncbi:hypothetical protein JCM9279_004121 [Rhodotorula babjevae]